MKNKLLFLSVVLFFTITSFYAQKTHPYSFEISKKDFVQIETEPKLTEQYQEVEIGFEYNFNNHFFDYIYISNEGWLSFSKNTNLKMLIENGETESFITPLTFFKENNASQNYNVSYTTKITESQKYFIVQWKNNEIAFQVCLYESGKVEFRYKYELNKIKELTQNYKFICGIINSNSANGYFPFLIKHKKIIPLDENFIYRQNSENLINKPDSNFGCSEIPTKTSTRLPKTTDNFTTPGAATWTCPAGVTSVTVHCIGGGGGGGGTISNTQYGGGGGAGGSYATKVVTVVPGNTYNLYVGTGGAGGSNSNGVSGEASWFNNTSEVYAVGGAGGGEPNGGTANGGTGTTTGCIGTTVYAGGNGADGTTTVSGGGGGGAGTTGSGGNASGVTGGTGTASGGGDGGNGRNNNEGNGRDGLNYGGGGSGAFVPDNTNHAGGAGAGGSVQLVYSATAGTFDGTFESGTSFVSNGMTEVNDATNYWIVGTVTDNGGVNSAYITNDGSSNAYNNSTTQVSHFYFDYDFPAGATSITLDFDWKCDGEGSYDRMRVYIVATTTTPVAGTELAGGQVNSVNYSEQTIWQNESIILNAGTLAGTTQRVVFSWRNDGSLGQDPPVAVDNIQINSIIPSPCATPTAQPTALNLTPTGSNQIDGSFTAASPTPDKYLVVYSTNSSLSADPTDGVSYAAGDAIGGGTVLQNSTATSFSHTCIAPNTTFYYFIFSVNDQCTGGPLYLSGSSIPSIVPLTGNATTGAAFADKTLPYFQNFDTDDSWVYGAGGIWERGNQTDDAFGPPSGHSGNTVAGTNLNANYAISVDDYLVTPSFDLTGTNGPIVDFWMDLETESSFDGGTVQIQRNGCSWITVDMNDPGYSGLTPNDTDVDGLQNLEDGWSGTQPAGEWDQVKIDLFALTTSGLNNISSGDIVKVRFWFGSDGSTVYPGWYIDDYSIYDPAPCSEPTAQPTNLVLTPSYTTIDGTFSAAVPAADEYLVVISTDPTLSAGDLPVDGTNYSIGSTIGDGTVVLSSASTSFTATGLTMGTTYYFFIFSYNATACAGRNYLTSNPLTGNMTTYDCSTGTVPYHEDFDGVSTPTLPSCWIIEDNSAPDDDWVSYSTNPLSSPNDMHISYDFSNPLDDWAFSPGLILTGGTTYTLEFYYRAGSSSYNESLKVEYGTAQSSGSMTNNLFTNASFNHTTYQLVSVNFTPGSNGTYYFGWHAYSATNQLGIYVDDIFIYEPGPPTITNITPDYLYEDKGRQITISGTNLGAPTSVSIGGVVGTVVSANFSEAIITFPAGNYSNNTLTYSTALGSTTTTVDVRVRNIIPVNASAVSNDDEHQTITSAVNGLFAWYGTTAFNAGDLAGEKIIQVMAGTYPEMVVPNINLNPVATAQFTIEAKAGQQVIVDASGLNYGFDVNIDYTKIKGFTVKSALNDNIRTQGNNCEISYNKCYKAQGMGIRAYQTTILIHNLIYNNVTYGIYLENAANAVVKQNTVYKNGGSPGASGYTRTVDLGSGTIYNWEYFPGWTQIPSVDDDTYVVDFGGGNNFPFNFSFWGTDFITTDILGISSNGILNLGSSFNITYFNHLLSDDYTNNNTLNCNWDDMDADTYTADGKIQYSVEGTAPYRRLIVVWYHRTHYRHRGDAGASNTDYVSVEAKIFETTNVIEFHYNDLVYDTDGDIAEDYDWASSSTIGIKKDNAVFDQYHYSTEDVLPQVDADHGLEGGAIRYSPNPSSGTELYITSGSNVTVENNIMFSLDDGGTSPYYVIQAPAGVITNYNYNDTYKGFNTNLVKIGGIDYADLAAWGIGGIGNIETDPKFVDIVTSDYHIKSSATGASFHNGEWPPLTAGAGTWTADGNLSPCVDTGDPAAAFNLEQPDNGSRLNIGCYGNTFQATKTNVLTGIWTGAVDTVWNVPNNWSDASVPTGSCVTGPGSNATIPDVSAGSGNFPYINSSTEVENLTIDANANLQIAPTGSLTVCGTLTNNGGNAGLVIRSDASGTGSLIHSTTNVPGTVESFLSGTQYHYIGSPVIGATDVSIGIQGGTNGVQFYNWDASMHWNGMGASPPATIDYAPWGTAYSGTLNVGTGYAYYYTPSTLNYTGNLNTGNYTLNLRDESGVVFDADQGWNLVSNPYPSSLDWDIVTGTGWDNDVESAIYLFDDVTGTGVQANYKYYVPAVPGTGGTYGVGTGNATKNIPIGQGFFIKSDLDNQPLDILNSDRIHSTQSFYKGYTDFLRLSVEGNGYSDEMIVRFISDATVNFDGKFDARKLIPPSPSVPQIYSITDDGSILAINSMPKLDKSFTVPLTFICEEGLYNFNTVEFNFAYAKVYIEDLIENETIQLKEGSLFSFNHTGGISSDRFILHFVINTSPYLNKFIDDYSSPDDIALIYKVDDDVFIDDDFGDVLTWAATLSNNTALPEWLLFNSESKTFTSSNPQIGIYNINVKATDISGETIDDEFTLTIYKSATGLNNITNEIRIFPNPSKGYFTIISDNGIFAEKIEITDVTGKIVYQRKDIRLIPRKIDISDKEPGVYFLKIHLENTIFYHKIIVE